MSNLARLEAVSTSLDTAINKANALPDAGSGGGTSVETCTVELNYESGSEGGAVSFMHYAIQQLEDNTIVNKIVKDLDAEDNVPSLTLTNIVCNSLICVYFSCATGIAGFTIDGSDLDGYADEIIALADNAVGFNQAETFMLCSLVNANDSETVTITINAY